MVTIIPMSSVVEENGKTIRENNLAIQYKIPLNTLVEVVDREYSDYSKMRGYVVHRSRDCDGTPLYYLGPKDFKYVTDLEEPSFIYRALGNKGTFGAFGEDSLIVLEPLKEN